MASEEAKTMFLLINGAVGELISGVDEGDIVTQLVDCAYEGGADAVVMTRILLGWITQEFVGKCDDLDVDPMDELFRENVELLGL